MRCFILPALIIAWNYAPLGADGAPSTRPDDHAIAWRFEHDAAGHLTAKIDPGGKRTDISCQSRADKTQRITIGSPDSQVVRDFDARARLVKMTDPAGVVDYQWDSLGELKRVQRHGGPKIEYEYDSLGRLAAYTLGSTRIGYEYDYRSRIVKIATPFGNIAYDYLNGQGKILRTLPNGVRTLWEYGPDGKLHSIIHADTGDRLLAEFDYTYGVNDRIVTIEERGESGRRQVHYAYDQAQRLTNCNESGGETWQATYDEMGNRTRLTMGDGRRIDYPCDWAGRLLSNNGSECDWDSSGNLVRAVLGDAERQFEYDHGNRLKSCNRTEVVYEYDGDGNLIARTARGSRMSFVPDPLSDNWRPLAARTPNGKQRLYLWSGCSLLAVVDGDSPAFLLHDQLGSVRLLVNAQGGVIARCGYSAFGTPQTSRSADDLTPGFAGLFWDPVAGAYLTRARAYSPELARFLQMDPEHRVITGSQKSLSVYAYCGDDPVNFVDVTGADADSLVPPEDSPVSEHLSDLTSDHVTDLAFQVGEMLPGAWGEVGEFASNLHEWWGLGMGAMDAADAWATHRGDPGTAWKVASVPLDFYSLLSPSELLGPAAGGIATLGDTAYTLGQDVRSRMMQNRLERMTSFGGAIPRSVNDINEEFADHTGFFSAGGDRLSMRGSWSLSDTGNVFTSRSGQSTLWARTQVNGLSTANGSLITGTFDRSERRFETGGNVFNAFEPTSETITRYGHDVYQIVRNGSMIVTDDRASANMQPGIPRIPVGYVFPERPDDIVKKKPDVFPGPFWLDWTGPSPVGGVYLGGSGRSLEGLGQLRGISVDAKTGSLILLADQGDINLPPLRMDDVVTIFRSVYLFGEAPSVTINPRPNDPTGPVMDVVHGTATPDTYVGWVLFEADRMMKGYNLGRDNITKTDIVTKAPNYADVLNTLYFGDKLADGNGQERWERFWIVPAQTSRFQAATNSLTLLDVPLKVRTQKMVLKGGILEDELDGASSPGAVAFVDWFTSHLAQIEAECLLQPPPETGIAAPVPVYTELRRIALITAIAESLRDQKVPMPAFMRDYAVKKISMPTTTPSLTLAKSKKTDNEELRASIYGGVDLAPADEVKKTLRSPEDLKSLLPEEQKVAAKQLHEASELATATGKLAAKQPFLVPFAVATKDKTYEALKLPGADSKALAPCRMQEFDLVAPSEGGVCAALVRRSNSFFDPSGEWGRGWTMDLPVLAMVKVPVTRTEKETEFTRVFDLSTPLNSIHARFSCTAAVAKFHADLPVPDEPCAVLALADAQDAMVAQAEHEVLLRDGRSWFFDAQGRFVAERSAPVTTLYARDEAGRLCRIVGYYGEELRATIDLKYDETGRLQSAQAQNLEGTRNHRDPTSIAYEYSSDGSLKTVTSSFGRVIYGYKNRLVQTVSWSAKTASGAWGEPQILQQNDYAPNGQLIAQTMGNRKAALDVQAEADGWRMTITPNDNAADARELHYDAQLRPLRLVQPDNSTTQWEYLADRTRTITTSPDGTYVCSTLSADGRQRVIENADRAQMLQKFDEDGMLTQVDLDGQKIFSLQWHPSGQLSSLDFDTHSVVLAYDDAGRVAKIQQVCWSDNKKGHVLAEETLNGDGRVSEIKDDSGADIHVAVDPGGNLTGLSCKWDGNDWQINVTNTSDGRITRVQSPWGSGTFTYAVDRSLSQVKLEKEQAIATVEYEQGRIKTITQFDQGKIRFDYYSGGELQGRLKTLQTSAIKVGYAYRPDGRLQSVDCGQSARVSYNYDGPGNVQRVEWTPLQPQCQEK